MDIKNKKTYTDLLPERENFCSKLDGKQVDLYTLSNALDMHVSFTNYGARIVNLLVPDSKGVLDNVVLGYDTIDEYLTSNEVYFGALIGRYGNRIANGTFSIENEAYRLERNEKDNHLHGGFSGLHSVVWDVYAIGKNFIQFRCFSKDGEGGYPGNLHIDVKYSLNNYGELTINYCAISDKKTIINLTNHAYFNLAGSGNGTVADHLIKIEADEFIPVDDGMIPIGEIWSVDSSPFDFRTEKKMGDEWDMPDQQLKFGGGYDHNFVLLKKCTAKNGKPELAVSVKEPVSGRKLELETTEPGLQFYTGNAMDGSDIGREGVPYNPRSAFCLEPQHFPDSPNQENFPNVVLEPEEEYKSTSVYRFFI